MEPLNTQERTSALIKFIVFFAITSVLVVTATFFDFFFGKKVTDHQKTELIELRSMQQDVKLIAPLMDSIKMHLGRYSMLYPPAKEQDAFNRYQDSLYTFTKSNGVLGTFVKSLHENNLMHWDRASFEVNLKRSGSDPKELTKEIKEKDKKIEELEDEIKDLEKEIKKLSE